MGVSNRTLLDVATVVLVASPSASMGDVAAAAGISRTTLHSRFPSREALLAALAADAMDLVEQAYGEARLEVGAVMDALRRLVALLVPLGPRLDFLLRERSLDDDAAVTVRYSHLERPIVALFERGQLEGVIRADLPPWWLASGATGLVSAAWEAIADGRLAPRDAAGFVVTTLLDGVGP